MKVFILVPVFNEGKVFLDFFPRLLAVSQRLNAQLVVIDDGSKVPISLAENQQVVTLRHPVNCGVGAAVNTGLRYARRMNADFVITIDGDGQHNPDDLAVVLSKMQTSPVDIVNGSRFLKKQAIPFTRRMANAFANLLTFLLSGFWLTDTQSGIKGVNKSALKQLELLSPGYEWCTDIFREANWYGLQVSEVPVSVSYSDYTLKKGQNFATGIDMLMRLVLRSLSRS